MYVDIEESNMGKGDDSGKFYKVALKKKEKGVEVMGQ